MNEVGLIRIHQFGGPEMLQWEHSGLPDLKPGEVLVRHEAIGLNFIDTYHRSGLYPIDLPSGLGLEAAGIVEEIGPEVTHLNQGDRVVYATAPIGAYSEQRVCHSKFLIRIPDNISFETAAASMLKGMTAEFLMERVFKVSPEHTILIHAAGGGVGQIAVRWAKSLGVKVIGTAGSDAKMGLARDAGCDIVIDYSKENFADTVMRLTDGKGV
ncbi:MAG: quinone oxidoreductase, partial [Candidatus Omnitrophica bacterium]|nr:quinone oxidoreductase [Candidatus Omnitrophota bacterium]